MPVYYRKLTTEEIKKLTVNGCRAEYWDNIEVTDKFTADNIRDATFAGHVKIGDNNGKLTNRDGIVRNSGICRAEVINCTIGHNVYIYNVGSYISNYDIGDNAYIENVGKIACRGECNFGNGTEVAAVNENGGRAFPIYDKLTAQTAYIMTMYRHRPKVIARLREMIESYCSEIRSGRGTIAEGAMITNCNVISDVKIGPYAIINCATMLTNGTVNSNKESPTYIGAGVKAHDFIMACGSVADNRASLNRCYVGEACDINYGYTATDSLFFANCYMSNGEACSVFAGPYTVAHHKSSLLIAGYYLFFNAGSGSNQSNHLFKTGAVHQGIHERGCKFGSDAYVMLPASEGAFTIVLGRHKSHHDTKNFPYSILMEEDGKSYLVPGINIRSYGTLRDLEKWEKRDKRGSLKRDRINFEEHNPYIGMKLLNAISESQSMLAKEGIEIHNYNKVKIKSSMLRHGLGLYNKYLEALIGDILSKGFSIITEVDTHWIDAAGMFASKRVMNSLLDKIEEGSLNTLDGIETAICGIGDSYQNHAYAWAIYALGSKLGREPTPEDISRAIVAGKEEEEAIHEMREADALKDSDSTMATGYGIDASDKQEHDLDFKLVREL